MCVKGRSINNWKPKLPEDFYMINPFILLRIFFIFYTMPENVWNGAGGGGGGGGQSAQKDKCCLEPSPDVACCYDVKKIVLYQ